MKKQVIILFIALTASFYSFGQAAHDSDPRTVSCTDDPLHPKAGKPYTYTAGSNQDGDFTFWATKNTQFITTDAGTGVTSTNLATRLTTTGTPPDLLTTSANYGAANSADNVQITWSDQILSGTTAASPTFVAVLKDGTCTNNFNAWSIQPINAFVVDIKNMNHSTKASLAYDAAENQCFDQVKGASWNGTAMQYNFGTQVLYYEVVAANFTNYYIPTLTLSGLGSGQSAVIEWAYDKAFTSPVTVTSGTPSGTHVTTNATDTSTGVSIYVRVTITNNTFEGINSTPITLAVDGQNSVGLWDVVNADCSAPGAADEADTATQTLDPRPSVTPTTPDTFVPGNQTN